MRAFVRIVVIRIAIGVHLFIRARSPLTNEYAINRKMPALVQRISAIHQITARIFTVIKKKPRDVNANIYIPYKIPW